MLPGCLIGQGDRAEGHRAAVNGYKEISHDPPCLGHYRVVRGGCPTRRGHPYWITFMRPNHTPDHSEAHAYLAARAAMAEVVAPGQADRQTRAA